jgi:hypothetical protein
VAWRRLEAAARGPETESLGNGGTPVKAVRFDEYGGIDVLKVVDVPRPVPGTAQVLVQVKAAGINPGESNIRVSAAGWA